MYADPYYVYIRNECKLFSLLFYLALVLLRIRPDNEDFDNIGCFLDIIDKTTADPRLA